LYVILTAGSATDSLRISTKRSTFSYKLPNTVLRGNSQASLIQKESFNFDWMAASNDEQVSTGVKVKKEEQCQLSTQSHHYTNVLSYQVIQV